MAIVVEGVPKFLTELMDKLPDEIFLKLVVYRSDKIMTVPNDQLALVDRIVCKMGEIATTVRITTLNDEDEVQIIEEMPDKPLVTPAAPVHQKADNPTDIIKTLGESQTFELLQSLSSSMGKLSGILGSLCKDYINEAHGNENSVEPDTKPEKTPRSFRSENRAKSRGRSGSISSSRSRSISSSRSRSIYSSRSRSSSRSSSSSTSGSGSPRKRRYRPRSRSESRERYGEQSTTVINLD